MESRDGSSRKATVVLVIGTRLNRVETAAVALSG